MRKMDREDNDRNEQKRDEEDQSKLTVMLQTFSEELDMKDSKNPLNDEPALDQPKFVQ